MCEMFADCYLGTLQYPHDMETVTEARRYRRVLLRFTHILEDVSTAEQSGQLRIRLEILYDVTNFLNDSPEVEALHAEPWQRLIRYRSDPFSGYGPLLTPSVAGEATFDAKCLRFLESQPRVFESYGEPTAPYWSTEDLDEILSLLGMAASREEVLEVRDIAGVGGDWFRVPPDLQLHVNTLRVPSHFLDERADRIKSVIYREDTKRAYHGRARY